MNTNTVTGWGVVGEQNSVVPSDPDPVSEQERDQAITILRHHTGLGRLTLDEFADRAGLAFAAEHRSDLAPLLADLPALQPLPPPPLSTTATDDRPAKPKRKRIVAIMSGARRAGHWRANAHMTTVSFWGGVELDLRGAVVESPVIDIRAWVVMGGCEIIVPEGVPVEVDGFILMGGLEDRVRPRPGVPRLEGPVIRVHGFGMWGGVTVRTRRTNASGEEVREIAQQMVSDALDRHHERTERRAARHTGMVGGIPGMPGLPGLPPFAQIPEPPAVRMPPLAVPHIPPSPLTNSREPRPNWGPHPPRTPFLAGLGSLIEQFAHVEDAPLAPAPTAPPTLPTGTVTILFTDIAHSTEMAERIGDQRWIGVLGAHNALVRAEIAKHGGTEVKHSGDGFMVVYPSARRALLSAIAIQRSMAEYRKDHPDQPIEVRIGLHTGEVIEEQGDYFGRNVILAARIASSAKGGEILASGLVKELADSGGDLGFDEGHDVELKGMSRPWRVHVVSW